MKGRIINVGCFRHTKAVYGSQPFAIYFVIAPEGFFVVKGMCEEVDHYVKVCWPRCIYRSTYWKGGISRGDWHVLGLDMSIEPKRRDGIWDHRYYFSGCINGVEQTDFMVVRRIPKRWLPIYDEIGPEKKPVAEAVRQPQPEDLAYDLRRTPVKYTKSTYSDE